MMYYLTRTRKTCMIRYDLRPREVEINIAVDKGQGKKMDTNMIPQRKNTLIRMIAVGTKEKHTLATLTKTGNIANKGVLTALKSNRRTNNTGLLRISIDSAPTLRSSSARAGTLGSMTENNHSINGAHTTSMIENTANMSKNFTDSRRSSTGNSENNRSVLVKRTLVLTKAHKKL